MKALAVIGLAVAPLLCLSPSIPAKAQGDFGNCGCEKKSDKNYNWYWHCTRAGTETFAVPIPFDERNAPRMPKGCTHKDIIGKTKNEVLSDMERAFNALNAMRGISPADEQQNQSGASTKQQPEGIASSTPMPTLQKMVESLQDPYQKTYMGYTIDYVDFEAPRNASDMLDKSPKTPGMETLRQTLNALEMSPQWAYSSYLMKSTITVPSGKKVEVYKVCFDVRNTNRTNTIGSEEIIADPGISVSEKRNAAKLGIWSIFYSFKTKCLGGLPAETQQAYEQKFQGLN